MVREYRRLERKKGVVVLGSFGLHGTKQTERGVGIVLYEPNEPFETRIMVRKR